MPSRRHPPCRCCGCGCGCGSDTITVRESGTRRQGCDESPGWLWPASPLLEAYLVANLSRLVFTMAQASSGMQARESTHRDDDQCDDASRPRNVRESVDVTIPLTAPSRPGAGAPRKKKKDSVLGDARPEPPPPPPPVPPQEGDVPELCPLCQCPHVLPWSRLQILELGSGTGWLALRLASRGAFVMATDRHGALPLLVQNVVKNQVAFALAQEQRNDDPMSEGGHGSGEDPKRELKVQVEPLEWGQECEADLGALGRDHEGADVVVDSGWDVIVACEVVYLHESHAPLLRTLRAQCSIRDRFLRASAAALAGGTAMAAADPTRNNPPSEKALGATLVVIAWEERHPAEEARFLELAREMGFARGDVDVGVDGDVDVDGGAPSQLGANEATSNRIWLATLSLVS